MHAAPPSQHRVTFPHSPRNRHLGDRGDAPSVRSIPDCEIAILPRAGHIMSVDEPEFVGARITGFLEDEKG